VLLVAIRPFGALNQQAITHQPSFDTILVKPPKRILRAKNPLHQRHPPTISLETAMPDSPPWWQTTTIYQIYPRSFADSNDDGIGDLPGIIAKLDYIRDLGFETIWISPFFRSPQQDFGYDVSDYCDVAPEYGTLADAEALIEAVHARGMRILLDLVLNHTSIEHPWFQESRSSRDNPKRDWYIWRDGRGSGPPNNWKAIPGGSGWHYDESTDQWYYASFLPFQPD
jgi:oligo-1,6-glucosidase/alpha-glucosidase